MGFGEPGLDDGQLFLPLTDNGWLYVADRRTIAGAVPGFRSPAGE